MVKAYFKLREMKKRKMTFEITYVNEQGRTLKHKAKANSSKELIDALNPTSVLKVEMYY